MLLRKLLSTVPFTDGINNYGNTCFISSVLQMLFRVPELCQYNLYVKDHIDNSDSNVSVQFILRFYQFVEKHFRNDASAETSEIYKMFLRLFFHLSNRRGWQFVRHEQADAHEFLLAFFDLVESGITSLKEKPLKYPSLFDYAKTTTLTLQSMYCNILQKIECQKGHKTTTERNEILSLKVKSFNDINQSISNYFDRIVFNGNNLFNCVSCKTYVNAVQTLSLRCLPNYLIIHFMLFTINSTTNEVNQTYVLYP